jgi:hypothetical protein
MFYYDKKTYYLATIALERKLWRRSNISILYNIFFKIHQKNDAIQIK